MNGKSEVSEFYSGLYTENIRKIEADIFSFYQFIQE